jgi:O-antigen ligase
MTSRPEETLAGGTGTSVSRPAHLARIAVAVVASVAFGLPLLAVRSLEAPVGPVIGVLVAIVLVATALRPIVGLSALILILPLSIMVEQGLRGAILAGDVVDVLVLSFACAGSLSILARGRETLGRLGPVAAVLVIAIVTSAISELRLIQAITPGNPVLPVILHHLTRDYWTDVREWAVLQHTWRWLAWIVTALCVERVATASERASRTMLNVWIAAGAAGSILVLMRVIEIVSSRGGSLTRTLVDLSRYLRLSVLQPDVNAAGSYLLLFLLPVLFVVFRRGGGWLLGVVLPVLLLAFGLARSRAAVGAGIVVLCLAGLTHQWHRAGGAAGRAIRRRALAAVVVVALGMAAVAATLYGTAASNAAVEDAMRVRLDLAEVGVEALKRAPVFGVGPGDYINSTRRFITPDMTVLRAMAPHGENAHNNFLQIAVELGVPACLVFLWLVVRAIGPGLAGRRAGPAGASEGLALGIVAFLLSAMLGHPLLVPLVGSAFFVALGLSAGLAGRNRMSETGEAICWLLSGVYLGSLLWRW